MYRPPTRWQGDKKVKQKHWPALVRIRGIMPIEGEIRPSRAIKANSLRAIDLQFA